MPRREGGRREEATLRSQTNFTFDIFSVLFGPRSGVHLDASYVSDKLSRDRRWDPRGIADGSNPRCVDHMLVWHTEKLSSIRTQLPRSTMFQKRESLFFKRMLNIM